MTQVLSETIRTIRVGITGTSDTASYTLAPGLAQYVEAVYIEVDNGAASSVRPILTISEQAGVVIAKRRQGGTIAAGDTGSATWALRLSGDDQGDTGLTGIFYDTDNTGDWLQVEATGHSPVTFPVGGIDSDWSIGLTGPSVAVGGDDALWLVSPVLVHIGEPGGSIIGNTGTTGDVEFTAATISERAHDTYTVNADSHITLNGTNIVVADLGQLNIEADAGMNLTSTGGDTTFETDDFNGTSDFLNWSLSGSNAPSFGLSNTPEFFVGLGTGCALNVYDHLGNPIFRVNEDGSLQGKTGKTLTFNL